MPNQQTKIPHHVGIIMDGNGRWASARGESRSFGHKIGAQRVEEITEYAFNKGIKTITLFAFSSENWQRPKEEVDKIMGVLQGFFENFALKYPNQNIKLKVIGDKSTLSSSLARAIEQAELQTKNNSQHVLNIAINYGARQEIVNAVQSLLSQNKEITTQSLSSELYTASCGEPDLIIRTGGEVRLSNFMLYQGAYSELYFTNVLWPDFGKQEFQSALEEFSNRNRRFGNV